MGEINMQHFGLLLPLLLLGQLVFAGGEAVQVAEAVNNKQLMPQFGQQLDIAGAYHIQTLAVSQLLADRQPDGFKAGLTSTAGQKKFSVEHPVAGVLLAESQLAAAGEQGYVVQAGDYSKLMLELEIGFRLKEAITRPISDVATLKTMVETIHPVIEMPDLGFQQMEWLLATDIIANNVVARNYIVGAGVAGQSTDINTLSVKLYRDEQLLLEGLGSDAMGDQWRALGWLINQTLASGWTIEPGQILITGALGRMVPGKPGKYSARFSELGSIEWDVVAPQH